MQLNYLKVSTFFFSNYNRLVGKIIYGVNEKNNLSYNFETKINLPQSAENEGN